MQYCNGTSLFHISCLQRLRIFRQHELSFSGNLGRLMGRSQALALCTLSMLHHVSCAARVPKPSLRNFRQPLEQPSEFTVCTTARQISSPAGLFHCHCPVCAISSWRGGGPCNLPLGAYILLEPRTCESEAAHPNRGLIKPLAQPMATVMATVTRSRQIEIHRLCPRGALSLQVVAKSSTHVSMR